jgi:hypothetical protein
VFPPAENKAKSGAAATASSKLLMVQSRPPKVTVLPTLLEDATGINSVTGKLRSAKTFKMIWPTIPVAPTTAILINALTYLEPYKANFNPPYEKPLVASRTNLFDLPHF